MLNALSSTEKKESDDHSRKAAPTMPSVAALSWIARTAFRIEVTDVQIHFDRADTSLIYIDIRYAVGDTNDPRNLVFPFYTIPAEE